MLTAIGRHNVEVPVTHIGFAARGRAEVGMGGSPDAWLTPDNLFVTPIVNQVFLRGAHESFGTVAVREGDIIETAHLVLLVETGGTVELIEREEGLGINLTPLLVGEEGAIVSIKTDQDVAPPLSVKIGWLQIPEVTASGEQVVEGECLLGLGSVRDGHEQKQTSKNRFNLHSVSF